MVELRRLRIAQLEAQEKEVQEGTREKVIKISTVLPMDEPKNAALFRDKQLKLKKTGRPAPKLSVPDRGKSDGSKSVSRPPKPPAKESGPVGSYGYKRASEGPTSPPKKSKGKASEDPESDLKAEVARLATLGELDRMVELASVHRKV